MQGVVTRRALCPVKLHRRVPYVQPPSSTPVHKPLLPRRRRHTVHCRSGQEGAGGRGESSRRPGGRRRGASAAAAERCRSVIRWWREGWERGWCRCAHSGHKHRVRHPCRAPEHRSRGLLLTIEVSAVAFGGGPSLPASTHWEQVPATLPVIIFTLVYHDIAPVICAYLEWDLARIRLSIIIGSLVPLASLLVWDDVALSVSGPNGFAILDMLKTEWGYTVVETFSLLAVGTSLIGTLLAASQFFLEQMTNLASSSSSTKGNVQEKKIGEEVFEEEGSSHLGWKTLLENNRLSYVATGVVVVPTVLIAAGVPDSFSIATDIAGGYCMTILYDLLPPLMAWSIGSKLSDQKVGLAKVEATRDFTSAKPVLVGMGVFSVLMVFQQFLQDLVSFNTYILSWAS